MTRECRSKRGAEREKIMREDDFIDDGQEEDIEGEDEPPVIDPYEVLGLETEATADDVKKAYRKMALKHHPDKAADGEKNAANRKFQEIAFAYSVLSDDRRRKRYDLTGSTAELLENDDDFNWLKFYREQFENVVNEEAINRISEEYRDSAEERQDILNAYVKCKGNLDTMYGFIMLSDILEDDDRFRKILDEEIENGNIKSFPAYEKETDTKRKRAKDIERKRREDYDKREAEKEEAKTANGNMKTKPKPKAKKGSASDMADLAALIQQRQKSRAGGFFDQLEAKYAPNSRGSKRSTPMDEPPEEMFQANRTKKAKKNTRVKKLEVGSKDDENMLGEEDIGDSEEEEKKAPRKSKARAKAKARGRASTKV